MDNKTKSICSPTSYWYFKNIFTVRIHLDDTNFENGALKVIDKSHDKGIFRSENINWNIEKEIICDVEAGGIILWNVCYCTVLTEVQILKEEELFISNFLTWNYQTN